MTRHYPDVLLIGRAGNLLQPIRSLTQIWMVHVISMLKGEGRNFEDVHSVTTRSTFHCIPSSSITVSIFGLAQGSFCTHRLTRPRWWRFLNRSICLSRSSGTGCSLIHISQSRTPNPYTCCGSILSLVQILFFFVSNSLSYITIPQNKRK